MEIEQINKLTRDLKQAAKTLSTDEARFLVDYYYALQEDRIRSAHQVRTLAESGEPHELLSWLGENAGVLERNIKSALDTYSSEHLIGQWSKSIVGIGPIIAAGLLAHIDINKAPTVGHIWRFAGLDPTVIWEKKTKRPWNASLKTLCWKIGESFVKFSNHDEDFYGHLLVQRKAYEIANNEAGKLSEQAVKHLSKFKIGKDTEAYIWYSGCLTPAMAKMIQSAPAEKRMGMAKKLAVDSGSGTPMLPPGHIHARAKRWAVKLFLAHWQHVAYSITFKKEPPRPYVLTHLGHVDEIKPPNWPMK